MGEERGVMEQLEHSLLCLGLVLIDLPPVLLLITMYLSPWHQDSADAVLCTLCTIQKYAILENLQNITTGDKDGRN